MIRFSLFGIPVAIEPFFWITLVILGGASGADNAAEILNIGLFVIAGFISILVHELGHALTARSFGAHSRITLQAFGGYAAYTGGPDPLAPPVDLREALEQIGQDVMEGTSPRRALAELLRRPLGLVLPPQAFDDSALTRIHSPRYLAFLENAWNEWVALDPANATRDALPFFGAAKKVTFLTVSHDAPEDLDAMCLTQLAAHGCQTASAVVDRSDTHSTGTAIRLRCDMVGADMIVLGLYGHSRLQQLLLGGVSRELLSTFDMPMLVSH